MSSTFRFYLILVFLFVTGFLIGELYSLLKAPNQNPPDLLNPKNYTQVMIDNHLLSLDGYNIIEMNGTPDIYIWWGYFGHPAVKFNELPIGTEVKLSSQKGGFLFTRTSEYVTFKEWMSLRAKWLVLTFQANDPEHAQAILLGDADRLDRSKKIKETRAPDYATTQEELLRRLVEDAVEDVIEE